MTTDEKPGLVDDFQEQRSEMLLKVGQICRVTKGAFCRIPPTSSCMQKSMNYLCKVKLGRP